MVKVGLNGYLKRNKEDRNWWLVKHAYNDGFLGYVPLGNVVFPKNLVGKKVRFKVEVVKDEG